MSTALRLWLAVLCLCLGCGSSQPEPLAAPSTPPPNPAVYAYEVAVDVYVWADTATTEQYRGAHLLAVQATVNSKDEIQAQCTVELETCMQAVYESIMAKWIEANKYTERAERIKRAKEVLDAWHAAIVLRDGSRQEGAVLRLAVESAAALLAVVDELGSHGVTVPDELKAAVEALDGLAALAKEVLS